MIFVIVFGLLVFFLLMSFHSAVTGGVPQSRTPAMKRRVRSHRR